MSETPVAQRREVDLDDAQPVVEVLAESPLGDELLQVAVRRRDDPDVDLLGVGGAERTDLAVLEHAQQPDLHAGLRLADLVEKDRAAVGDLEEALLVGMGTGERAALVAEELALEQRLGQRAAVLGHELLVPARARIMDGAGEQILAGAGLARQQDRRVGLRDLLGHVEDLLHRRRVPDDAFEGITRLDLPAQVEILGAQASVRLGQGCLRAGRSRSTARRPRARASR